ncbi:MAG: YXWGXW repeat-containing protein [Gammaproteobacteria bacterium]|nr:YXWGXW repeat-containing protein [Gammaproteobacteria bacterium]
MSAARTALRRTPRLVVLPIALAVAAALAGCAAQVRVAAPAPAFVEPVAVAEVREAPPPLPVYEQPPCPEVGFIWTPGYWAWGGGGYYWVPGTWVAPPRVGVLWTPGYWGWVGGVYVWHAGYWGPHVGFYGGVNYGFGYVGVGYAGGRWVGNSFAYNASVTNVNVTVVHNTYNETVVNNVTVNNTTVNRVSYNGGTGGVAATPTPQERAAAQESHLPPTQLQQHHVQQAAANPALAAKVNGGHPTIAATAHPATFTGPGVVAAKPPHPPQSPAPAEHPAPAPNAAVHPAVAPRGPQPPVAAARPRPPGAVPHTANAQKPKPSKPGNAPGRERRDENRG